MRIDGIGQHVHRGTLLAAAGLLVALAPMRARAGGDPCLTAVSLTPMSGSGDSAIFEAIYGHCEGAQTFRVVQIWFGNEVAIDVPHAQGGFEDGMFVFGDAPGSSCAPGQALEISTPNATLDCAMSSATAVGNEMIVQWAVRFDPVAFGGARTIWFDAKGGAGDPEPRLGWTQVGSWNVQDDADGTGGSGSGDDTGATAGSVGAATGTGAATESDGGSESAGATGDPPGTLPGLMDDRSDGAGCSCQADERSPFAEWMLVLVLVAIGRARSQSKPSGDSPASSH
jgi:hypothetical protein